jgi:hypothetical protein
MTDIERVAKLKAFIASHAHLRVLQASEDDWSAPVLKALELFDSPHNMDQLWVWSRFVYLFGERDTWSANRELDSFLLEAANLLSLRAHYAQLQEQIESTSWWRFRTRSGIASKQTLAANAIQKSLYHLQMMLRNYIDRDKRWIDAADFAAYRDRVNG